MPSDRDLAAAALAGAASGLRTFAGPAALAARGRVLRDNPARYAVLAAGGLELAGDKTPFAPDRTDVPSVAGRSTAGAVSGAVLAGPAGAAVGAAAAAGST